MRSAANAAKAAPKAAAQAAKPAQQPIAIDSDDDEPVRARSRLLVHSSNALLCRDQMASFRPPSPGIDLDESEAEAETPEKPVLVARRVRRVSSRGRVSHASSSCSSTGDQPRPQQPPLLSARSTCRRCRGAA